MCSEVNRLVVDKQNSFWSDRSCQDHLFSVTSIVRNIIYDNLGAFCAFVDVQKAFDFIDGNLLLFKLRKYYGIDGNL